MVTLMGTLVLSTAQRRQDQRCRWGADFTFLDHRKQSSKNRGEGATALTGSLHCGGTDPSVAGRMNNSMSRRPRRAMETGGNEMTSPGSPQYKSQSVPWFSACVLFVMVVLFFGYLFGNSVFHHYSKSDGRKGKSELIRARFPAVPDHSTSHNLDSDAGGNSHDATDDVLEHPQEEFQPQVRDAIPLLQDVYGKYMQRVLHIGPGTCNVVASLLKEEKTEAWGVEPSDITSPSALCRNLIKKGMVRVVDVYRSLPYRSKTFSLVLTTGTLEHLTSRQLNRTLPELSRVTDHALVVFISSQPSEALPDNVATRQMQAAVKTVKHHNRTWWTRRFEMAGLEENEEMSKRFETLQSQNTFKTSDYIFHFLPRHLD